MKIKGFFFLFLQDMNAYWDGLRALAGLVIQAPGRTELEDGLRPGSREEVLCD